METFKYGKLEMEYLKGRDKVLGEAINRLGRVEREVIPDLFSALVNSIIGQQISAKAAATVWRRLQECLGEISPHTIAESPVEKIQKCGLTTRKSGYIKSISESVLKGEIDLKGLYRLSDEEVIKQLSSLNGIGEWTAEMLMLHSMERPDILSWGDIAIRRGMMKLYGLESLARQQFEEYRKLYSPYGSVASIYLWKISHE